MTLTPMKSVKVFVCGLASALIAGASFAAFPVSAAQQTYTLTYAETAALFGYDKFQTESQSSTVLAWDYSGDSPRSYYAPHMWYANYELGGVPYIGIRVYVNRSGFNDGRGNWELDMQLTTSITIENMYDFTIGAGFLTTYQGTEVTGDNLFIRYADNGTLLTASSSFNSPYSLVSMKNVDTGSSSSSTVVEFSPVTATAPVYDMYFSGDSYPYNFRLQSREPNTNLLSEPFQSEYFSGNGEDYFTGYTYIFIRCPTITADTDTLVDINTQLGTILDAITPDTDPAPAVSSVATQASADASAVSSALGEEHDFLHSFQYSGFPDGYDPTYSDDAVGLFAILFRFWENNQYAITVSAGAMALALVSYILYGKKF